MIVKNNNFLLWAYWFFPLIWESECLCKEGRETLLSLTTKRKRKTRYQQTPHTSYLFPCSHPSERVTPSHILLGSFFSFAFMDRGVLSLENHKYLHGRIQICLTSSQILDWCHCLMNALVTALENFSFLHRQCIDCDCSLVLKSEYLGSSLVLVDCNHILVRCSFPSIKSLYHSLNVLDPCRLPSISSILDLPFFNKCILAVRYQLF